MSEYTTEGVMHEVLWSKIDEAKPKYRRAFDRWLAEVKAQALEEAADEIFVQHDEITAMQREAFHRGADAVYNALRARAAEIRGAAPVTEEGEER